MNFASHSTGRPVRLTLLALALASLVSACGGGGGSPGAVGGTPTPTPTNPSDPAPVPATPTVAVSFATSTGVSSNALTGATPLTARATVRNASGVAVPNALVTFATDNTLAVFSPSAGTALTDANGVASVTLRAASLAAGGAGKVTASTTVAGATISSEANYSVGATALTFGTLTASPASIQAYGSTILSVDVFAAGAKYTDQQVNVSFSSACVTAGKATLAPVVATNNGTAQAVYRDQGCANDDLVTVAADGVARAVSASLDIAAPAAASVQFASATPTDKSIVIRGQGGISRTETATLMFRVFDTFGKPLAGKLVEFSAPSSVTLNKTSDSTDQNGEVITTVNSGSLPTTFRVQATLPGTLVNGQPISTLSDSIVVTTGLPVQRAFSLSAGTFNLDGTHDSSPEVPATRIQALLADAFGNPVPDGTPVVFQTNMGSVGSSSKGGCITLNGGCSVDFRTQNPRTHAPNTPATPCNTGTSSRVSNDSMRPGLATVCASTTDGTNTVFDKITLFFGGADATNVFFDDGTIPMSTTPISKSVPTDLGSVASGGSKVFRLHINDANLNPLPKGTTVSAVNVVNASVTVTPATIQDILPHSSGADDITGNTISGNQGSWHTISVSTTRATPCVAQIATFNVATTTPSGVSTSFPFKLAFTCQ